MAMLNPLIALSQDRVILTTGEYPPLNMENDKHSGLIPRIVLEAFKAEGIEVEYRFVPWKRAFIESAEGKVHGTIQWLHSDERAKTHHYSKPIMMEKYVWFYKKSAPIVYDGQLSSLENYTLGAVNGYTYNKQFLDAIANKSLKVNLVNSIDQNINMLMSGRIDTLIENLDVALYTLEHQFPNEVKNISYGDKALVEVPNHLLLSKKHDNSTEIMAKFNSGLDKIKQNGLYQRILDESRSSD